MGTVAFLILLGLIASCVVFLVRLRASRWTHITVKRVLDGDTFIDSNDESYRLLGVQTPEKNEKNYKEAKETLEKLLKKKE
jgi:endonuclease YncB( thermonuclease family)